MYCLWCWVLGVLFWRSHCCLLELKPSCCVSGCATQNHLWGSHLALGEPLWKKAWGYKFCPILEVMLEGICCLAWAGLLCAAGKSLWQRQPLLALLLWCSPRADPLGKVSCSHQSSTRCPCHTRFCPFGYFLFGLVALLSTALRLSDPRVALCWLFKFISCLPP